MRLHFNDRDFVFAHGRAPRGRGGWAFEFVRDGQRVVNPEASHHSGDLRFAFFVGRSCLFSEAKAWARAKARELGADEVRVCS